VVERVSGRSLCECCQRTYHVMRNKVKACLRQSSRVNELM
jgi:hypothetical protein